MFGARVHDWRLHDGHGAGHAVGRPRHAPVRAGLRRHGLSLLGRGAPRRPACATLWQPSPSAATVVADVRLSACILRVGACATSILAPHHTAALVAAYSAAPAGLSGPVFLILPCAAVPGLGGHRHREIPRRRTGKMPDLGSKPRCRGEHGVREQREHPTRGRVAAPGPSRDPTRRPCGACRPTCSRACGGGVGFCGMPSNNARWCRAGWRWALLRYFFNFLAITYPSPNAAKPPMATSHHFNGLSGPTFLGRRHVFGTGAIIECLIAARSKITGGAS